MLCEQGTQHCYPGPEAVREASKVPAFPGAPVPQTACAGFEGASHILVSLWILPNNWELELQRWTFCHLGPSPAEMQHQSHEGECLPNDLTLGITVAV